MQLGFSLIGLVVVGVAIYYGIQYLIKATDVHTLDRKDD